MKIIIAEMDWRFAHRARRYLEDRAHLVAFHTDPQMLIERVEQWRPDLVILAAELAEGGTLQRIMDSPQRPAVLLTEFMDRYDRAWRVWQVGGDEILMKPVFSTAELQGAIVTALENAASGRRLWRAAAAKVSA